MKYLNFNINILDKDKYIEQEHDLIKLIEKAIEEPRYDRFPLSPSQALKCARMLWYSLKNSSDSQQFPKDTYNARTILTFDAGNRAEWSLIKYLRQSKDFDVVYEQKSMVITENKEFIIKGTCDLILDIKGTRILVDIKSINQEGFKNSELPKIEHYAQVQLYLNSKWATEQGIKYGGILLYNKNMCQLKIKIFEPNIELATALVTRFHQIYSKYKSNELPNRDFLLGHKEKVGYSQCGYCSFKTVCYKNINSHVGLKEKLHLATEIKDQKVIDKVLALYDNENNERELIEYIMTLSKNAMIVIKEKSKLIFFVVYKTQQKIQLKTFMEDAL